MNIRNWLVNHKLLIVTIFALAYAVVVEGAINGNWNAVLVAVGAAVGRSPLDSLSTRR